MLKFVAVAMVVAAQVAGSAAQAQTLHRSVPLHHRFQASTAAVDTAARRSDAQGQQVMGLRVPNGFKTFGTQAGF